MSLFVTLQHIGPLKFSTAVFGALANIRTPWLKNWMIRTFIKKYDIDMNEALSSNIDTYPTFNAFFSRRLKPGARPFVALPELGSPVDGFVSRVGLIEGSTIIQAKGLDYSLDALLANQAYARNFIGGAFATLYLSPKDYHRVHTPLDATLTDLTFVPGDLYSVNPETVDHCPNLFARNERLIFHFQTATGPMAIILVGALNVGSMFTSWDETPVKSGTLKTWHFDTPKSFKQGDEMGGFLMGSTAIVLFPHNTFVFDPSLHAGQAVKMGERVGKQAT